MNFWKDPFGIFINDITRDNASEWINDWCQSTIYLVYLDNTILPSIENYQTQFTRRQRFRFKQNSNSLRFHSLTISRERILRIIGNHKTFPAVNRSRTRTAFSGTDRTRANPGVTRIDRRIVRPINRTISFTVYGESDWRYHDKGWWL